MEAAVDAQLEKLDNLKDDDLASIRLNRMKVGSASQHPRDASVFPTVFHVACFSTRSASPWHTGVLFLVAHNVNDPRIDDVHTEMGPHTRVSRIGLGGRHFLSGCQAQRTTRSSENMANTRGCAGSVVCARVCVARVVNMCCFFICDTVNSTYVCVWCVVGTEETADGPRPVAKQRTRRALVGL